MDKKDFTIMQFEALRKEVAATKARLFMTVCLGLVAVPVLTYLSEQPGARFLGPILPFVVLVLTMLFVAEENALMRCGRYIREKIEPQIEPGWEAWLESQPGLRIMDKCLFACFLLTFIVFYFASVGMAIETLMSSGDDMLPSSLRAGLGGVVYGIGALWMVITVMSHWRSSTATTP